MVYFLSSTVSHYKILPFLEHRGKHPAQTGAAISSLRVIHEGQKPVLLLPEKCLPIHPPVIQFTQCSNFGNPSENQRAISFPSLLGHSCYVGKYPLNILWESHQVPKSSATKCLPNSGMNEYLGYVQRKPMAALPWVATSCPFSTTMVWP